MYTVEDSEDEDCVGNTNSCCCCCFSVSLECGEGEGGAAAAMLSKQILCCWHTTAKDRATALAAELVLLIKE